MNIYLRCSSCFRVMRFPMYYRDELLAFKCFCGHMVEPNKSMISAKKYNSVWLLEEVK